MQSADQPCSPEPYHYTSAAASCVGMLHRHSYGNIAGYNQGFCATRPGADIPAHVGQLVVDDQVDIGDVEAARRHVGGDQAQRLAIAEALQHALPAGLRDVAVQRLQASGVTRLSFLPILCMKQLN
jgi:hypothetical protein